MSHFRVNGETLKYEIKIGTFFQKLDQDLDIDWKIAGKRLPGLEHSIRLGLSGMQESVGKESRMFLIQRNI